MRTLATTARTATLAAVAGALLFTGVAAQGTAVAAPQAPKDKLTVAGYRAFLKTKDVKTLKAFDKLPKAKQQKFVDYLQSPAVQKAYAVRAGGYVNRGGHNEEAFNKDVRFVADVKGVQKVAGGARHITLTFTATERIYGVPVITQKTVLSYQLKGGVKAQKFTRSVTNLNGAFAVTPAKNATVVVTGDNISATAAWNAAPLYKSAGTATITKRQVTSTVNVKFNAWIGNR
ncbi:hypothetical protein [Streptomyces graminofaciens]|nr:hypothetical protein [Streptomyces graminofaciens]